MDKNIGFAIALCSIGCIQVIGDVFNLPVIKAVGFITHASPAPKVFTAHQGFETFSSRFYIRQSTEEDFIELTPQIYNQVAGPYNRRNAYGATLSYGPILYQNPKTRSMFSDVATYALCKPGTLIKELGWQVNSSANYEIKLVPRESNSFLAADNLQWTIRCKDGAVIATNQQGDQQ